MTPNSQFALLGTRRFLPFFITQCFGAFNDNVFRQAIIGLLGVMAAAGLLDESTRGTYTQLAPAVFILPYFLFSSIAGQFAERTEKSKLIRITTAMEIAIMSLAAVGFLLQNMPLLLLALFCTGLQSTLFGPVKYSILPSVLAPEELTGGNGLVEMGTSISILLGMIFGGSIFLLAGAAGPYVAAVSIILLAVAKDWRTFVEYAPAVGGAALAFNLLSMAVGYCGPRLLKLNLRQAIAIAMEIGIHNGTLAIALALSPALLNNPTMAIPAAIYSLIMFITAALFGLWVNRVHGAELAHETVAEQ